MKTILLSVFSFCLLQNLSGQITGRLITANDQPVISASMALIKNTDSLPVKIILTDSSGNFRFEKINPGSYKLRATNIGYETWQSLQFEVSIAEPDRNFGTIILAEDKKQLGEVVVRSIKQIYQQKPEGLVVNVENSILTKGSSALQVLERSPGVVINRRDNSIELNGKSGVMVMLNGKLMRLSMEQVVTLLSGMSADDISSIELLTTPPAKYDAEGSAGLINIVLKKNKKQGTNGSVSLTAGYGYKEKGTASMNLSHNKNNLNLYGSYTFSRDNTYSNMYVSSTQDMPFLGGNVFVTGWFTSKFKRDNHDATVGFDYKLNPKTTLGASITYNNSRLSGSSFTNAGYNVLPDSLLQYTGKNSGHNLWNNLVNSIYVERSLRKEGKINAGIDYLYFNNTDHSSVQSSFINKHGMQAGNNESLFSPGQQGFANTTIKVLVSRIDYTKQLKKNITLEAGIKNAFTQSISSSGIESLINGEWTGSEQTSNHIRMKEGISALYSSVNSKLDASASLTVGLRYEYSSTNMDNSKSGDNIANRKLSAFFPSIFFSKQVSGNSELQLSYTKRISRPTYNDLASYVGYSDPTAVYTGNPFLKPTITHNIKMGYNYKSYSFSLLLSRDINAITRYQLSESAARDMLLISPQNLDWQNNITFQSNLPLKVNDLWTMNYGFVGWYRKYKVSFSKQPFEKEWFGYSFNFNQSFKLPESFSAELSGVYHSRSYDGTKTVKGFGTLNAGIKKELKNNGGSFQFSVSDILSSEHYFINYGTITEEAFSIKSYVGFYPESAHSPILKLTYSRSFGKTKKTQSPQKSVSEENERIQKN
jgi:outer membrane receptor protein involved in Fe transport